MNRSRVEKDLSDRPYSTNTPTLDAKVKPKEKEVAFATPFYDYYSVSTDTIVVIGLSNPGNSKEPILVTVALLQVVSNFLSAKIRTRPNDASVDSGTPSKQGRVEPALVVYVVNVPEAKSITIPLVTDFNGETSPSNVAIRGANADIIN